MVGLLSAGLAMAMLSGMAVAKDAGKSDCKKLEWQNWVRTDLTDFADQGECVSYVAEGGTLVAKEPAPTGAFQSACTDLGGSYEKPLGVYYGATLVNYFEGCRWYGDTSGFGAAGSTLGPICLATVGGSALGYPPSFPHPWYACNLD